MASLVLFGGGEAIVPWRWLVVFAWEDEGGAVFGFVPAKPERMMVAIANAARSKKAPDVWRVVKAFRWPSGARTTDEAARAWAAHTGASLGDRMPVGIR